MMRRYRAAIIISTTLFLIYIERLHEVVEEEKSENTVKVKKNYNEEKEYKKYEIEKEDEVDRNEKAENNTKGEKKNNEEKKNTNDGENIHQLDEILKIDKVKKKDKVDEKEKVEKETETKKKNDKNDEIDGENRSSKLNEKVKTDQVKKEDEIDKNEKTENNTKGEKKNKKEKNDEIDGENRNIKLNETLETNKVKIMKRVSKKAKAKKKTKEKKKENKEKNNKIVVRSRISKFNKTLKAYKVRKEGRKNHNLIKEKKKKNKEKNDEIDGENRNSKLYEMMKTDKVQKENKIDKNEKAENNTKGEKKNNEEKSDIHNGEKRQSKLNETMKTDGVKKENSVDKKEKVENSTKGRKENYDVGKRQSKLNDTLKIIKMKKKKGVDIEEKAKKKTKVKEINKKGKKDKNGGKNGDSKLNTTLKTDRIKKKDKVSKKRKAGNKTKTKKRDRKSRNYELDRENGKNKLNKIVKTNKVNKKVKKEAENKIKFVKNDKLMNKSIELSIRMPLTKEMVSRFMCDLMRSTVLFWNRYYGDIVLILDEEDKVKDEFTKILNSTLPFNFRIVYEKAPSDVALFKRLGSRFRRPVGYLRMFYSSFLQDLYATPNSIIAWTDSDVVMTMPIIKETIFRNGRLIVKGANTFKFPWVRDWANSTSKALGGLPMIADFMTYFSVYIYPSTIRNCREYILKTLKVENMERAMEKIAVVHVSPVCILLSYAFYFERDLYEWHIDILSQSLSEYNKEHSVKNHYLTENDISLELHQTIHRRHYETKVEPLKQALCFTYFHIGKTLPPSCDQFKGQVNWQLFEFQSQQTHIDSWCKDKKQKCIDIIESAYKIFKRDYLNKSMYLNTSKIGLVESLLFSRYNVKCASLEIKL